MDRLEYMKDYYQKSKEVTGLNIYDQINDKQREKDNQDFIDYVEYCEKFSME